MTAQLAARRARIAAGEKPLGWKVGLGAPASLEKPKNTKHKTHNQPENTTAASALAAIADIRPAIELADLDPVPAPDNLDVVVAGDIYQRHVILCEQRRAGASLDGIVSRTSRRNAENNRPAEPEALTGKMGGIVAHVAFLLV